MTQRLDYTATVPAGLKALGIVYGYIVLSGLPRLLVNLVYLRTSQVNGCAYCIDMNSRDLISRPEERTPAGVLVYTIGLVLAVALTATSWVANTSLLWAPGIPLGLTVLAIAQMEIHLMFFLHITTGPDNTDNVLALAFGILIVLLVVPVRCLSWRI
jgi:cytochrome o ubiquinol oxidase operon protein cyoD